MISDSKSRISLESDQSNLIEWLPSYLADITRCKVTSTDEIQRLLAKVATGDESSREELINCHLYYAYCVAKRHHQANPSVSLEDMVQEANLALVESIISYDNTSSTPFACHLCNDINHACEQVVNKLLRTMND